MPAEIIIVSGLPRSGTSLMMQILGSGGVPLATDQARPADIDNPRGYFEWSKTKQSKRDISWLADVRGTAVKLVSPLLYELPPNLRYRIIFMRRDMDEMLLSQEAMLRRLGRAPVPRDEMKRSYLRHLERLQHWLGQQPNMAVLDVNYNQLVTNPKRDVERVRAFLWGKLPVQPMIRAVDPSLYRNRRSPASSR